MRKGREQFRQQKEGISVGAEQLIRDADSKECFKLSVQQSKYLLSGYLCKQQWGYNWLLPGPEVTPPCVNVPKFEHKACKAVPLGLQLVSFKVAPF